MHPGLAALQPIKPDVYYATFAKAEADRPRALGLRNSKSAIYGHPVAVNSPISPRSLPEESSSHTSHLRGKGPAHNWLGTES